MTRRGRVGWLEEHACDLKIAGCHTTREITFDGNGDPVFDLVSSHGQHDDDQVDVICSILAA